MELAYYALIGVASFIAVKDFRKGIYLALVVDLLRDIVRKSSPGESVLITLAGAAVWGAIFVGVYLDRPGLTQQAYRLYPRLKKSITMLLVAVLFAGLLSAIQYRSGYKIAVLGAISYVMPLFGLAIGFAFPRDRTEITRLLQFYVVINAIFLIGVPLEYFHVEVSGLGGMRGMDWIRYRQGYIVDLMSGFYRSPDIMGLHAANTLMFCLSLLVLPKPKNRWLWLGLAVWACICLILGGRRKMIGMPFVFLASWFLVGGRVRVVAQSRGLIFAGVVAVVIAASLFVISRYDETNNYSSYASTLPNEGLERSYSVIGASLTTLRQSGIIGAGLGTATQGSYYVKVKSVRGWQEDGLSRLFLEFGLFGVILLATALWHFVRSFKNCFALTRGDRQVVALQVVLLACVLANGASFLISHQQFSGDPGSAIIVLMLLGMIFGAYRLQRRTPPAPLRRLQ